MDSLSPAIFVTLVTALVGGILYGVTQLLRWMYTALLYRLTFTVRINSDQQEQWKWLQHYLQDHVGPELKEWTTTGISTKLEAFFSPTPIRLPFEGHVIRVRIHVDAPPLITTDQRTSSVRERRVAVLWTRNVNRAYFDRFLSRIKSEYKRKHEKAVEYCMPNISPMHGDSYWMGNMQLYKRDLATLTLDDAMVTKALDAVHYYTSEPGKRFHKEHGIPYHLGLLLTGPPGNGKSSFILALASMLGSKVKSLALQTKRLDDNALAFLMKGAPEDDPPDIIVLEDIDCLKMTHSREQKEEETSATTGGVTLAGLLNALDGLGAPENAIVIMTTNNPDKLDAALLRPGRVDVRMDFTRPDDPRIAKHYLKFFPNETPHSLLTHAFVKTCRDASGATCSMADVQKHILAYMRK